MDMMTRTAIMAGSLVLVAIAAAAGWWFLGDGLLNRADPSDAPARQPYDSREGSVFDEFGEIRSSDPNDDRIVIRTGEGLTIPPAPEGTIAGLPDGPQFGWDRPLDNRPPDTGPGAYQPGWGQPQSGGAPAPFGALAPLPRTTAAERVEADCRGRGGGSYACRCLVRLARAALEPSEFEFLSLAEERDPRADRLSSAGLDISDLTGFSTKLVSLDANAQRRCGSGLKP